MFPAHETPDRYYAKYLNRTPKGRAYRKLIATLLEEYNHLCAWCGDPLTEESATVDHVHPRTAGGDSSISNLVPACHTCNNIKSDALGYERPLPGHGKPRDELFQKPAPEPPTSPQGPEKPKEKPETTSEGQSHQASEPPPTPTKYQQ